MDENSSEFARQNTAAHCRGCGGRIPTPSRVTHFEKRFCSEVCRLRWSGRRWRSDAIIVRRYFFHYLQFHAHPDYHAAGSVDAPCAEEYGHARFLDTLAVRCVVSRDSHGCPDHGPDDVPVNNAWPAPGPVLGPSLRDSVALLDDCEPELRREISVETHTERGRAQRMFDNARAQVEMTLGFGKCVELQRDPRVARRRKAPKEARQPVTPDYKPTPRIRNKPEDGGAHAAGITDNAPSEEKYTPPDDVPAYTARPLERTIMPGEVLPEKEPI